MARKQLIQIRRDTAANWTSVNPVLAAGEVGFETNTKKIKIGDGTTAWNSLTYSTTTPEELASGTPDADSTTKGKVQLAGDLTGTASNPLVKSRTATKTVGMVGADYLVASYSSGGAAIKAAVNAASSGDVIYVREGTYVFNTADTFNFGGKKITLIGAGKGKTIFQASGTNTSFAFIYDYFTSGSDPQYRDGIHIEGITFDINNDANFKAMELASSQNITIEDCEIINVIDTCAIQIGNIAGTLGAETDSQIEASASRNIKIKDLTVRDSDFGTREGILLVNCQNSSVTDCYFKNIFGNPPALICPFGYNRNVIIARNTAFDSTAPMVYVQQSDRILVYDNQLHMVQGAGSDGVASFNARNSQYVYFNGNTVQGYTDGSGGGGGMSAFDFTGTFDGHVSRYPDSSYIFFENNNITGYYQAITVPSQTTGSHRQNQSNIYIRNNTFKGGEWAAVVIGSTTLTAISDIFIEGNTIISGDYFDTGGITIKGKSSAPTALTGVKVFNNRVTPSVRSSAAGVWLQDVDNVVVENNILTGTGKGTYASTPIYSTGTVTITSQKHNIGVAEVDLPIADGGTGASTAAAARTALGVPNIAGDTFTGDVSVPDEAYGSGWNASLEVPTKNAVYDKIETIIASAQYRTFVTVGTADADYITDGTADDVQIQAAITAVNTAGGGVVYVKEGTYRIAAQMSLKSNVALIGAGIGKTILRYPSGTAPSNTNFMGLNSGTVRQYNNVIRDMTFDAQDQVDKGLLNFNGVVTNFELSNCELINVNCPVTARWPLRVGTIIDADIDGSASFNVKIHHNIFKNNDCNTFEVILLPGVRDSWLHHNKFEGNSNSLTDEVSIYGQNINVRYTDNIHKDWSSYAVGAKEGDQIDISNNTFTNSLSGATGRRAIRLYNLVNSRVSNNTITMPVTDQGFGIFLQDYNIGRDGHAQRNVNSYNIDISNNLLTNTFYGICNFTSTNANFAYKNITIRGNEFYNCMKSPIRFGPNTTGTIDIQYIHILNNVIHSWSGNIEGAISFYGDSTDATKIKNIFIKDNYVQNNTTGASSGAIRLSAATAAQVIGNTITSTGAYGAISVPNGGVATIVRDNIGAADNPALSIANGGTGASTAATARVALGVPNIAGDTFTGDINVPDEVYGSGWNGSLEVPTKNAVYDKIEAIEGGVYYTVGATGSDYTTDGTADDVQINQAIVAANAAGGGTVFIRKGTYALASYITLLSNVRISGDGASSTILRQTNGVNIDELIRATAITDVIFEDLTVDYNYQNNATPQRGMWIKAPSARIKIRNNVFKNAKGFAIALAGAGTGDVTIRNTDCEVTNNLITGIATNQSDMLLVLCNYGLVAGNKIIGGNKNGSLVLYESDYLIATDNHIEMAAGNGVGIGVWSMRHGLVQNNTITGAAITAGGAQAISVFTEHDNASPTASSHNLISNNQIYNVNTGFSLFDTSDDMFVGNKVDTVGKMIEYPGAAVPVRPAFYHNRYSNVTTPIVLGVVPTSPTYVGNSDGSTTGFGINTLSPAAPVHLVGDAAGSPVTMKVQNIDSGGTGEAQLLLGTSATLSNESVGASFYADRTNAVSTGDTDAYIKTSAGTAMTNRMRFKADGTVESYGDLLVPDEVYGSGWNSSLEVPTKNAVYDKIEALDASDGDVIGPASSTDNAVARFDTTTGKLLQNSSATISDLGNLVVTPTGNAEGISVSNAGSGVGVRVTGTGGSTGIVAILDTNSTSSAGTLVRNSSAVRSGTGTAALLTVHNVPTTGSGDGLAVTQNNPGIAARIDHNNTSVSLDVDKDATNVADANEGLRVIRTSVVTDAGTYTKSGATATITSNVIETSGAITDTGIVLDINQNHNDSTGNVVDIDNDGTGTALYVQQDGSLGASKRALWVNQTSDLTASSRQTALFYTNTAHTGGRLVEMTDDNSGSTLGSILHIQSDGNPSNGTLFIDNNNNSNSIKIDQDGNSASLITGLDINVANAGAGGAIAMNAVGNVEVTGNIAISGTVDGRDVSVDGTRLDTITDANYLNSNTTKTQVGLSNVDNTSDVNKPISTATQTALDTKVQIGGELGGTITSPTLKNVAKVFNVRDYGAIGNGIADDTTAWQSALTAAGLVGGTVYASSAIYKTTAQLTVPSGVSIKTDIGATLKPQSNFYALLCSSATTVYIEGLTIDGSANTTDTNSTGIRLLNCVDIHIYRCRVLSSAGFGIFVQSNSSNTIKRVWIDKCVLSGQGMADVIGGGPTNSTGAVVSDVFVTNCFIWQDCTVNSYQNVFDIVASTRLIFQGNDVQGFVQPGTEQFPHLDILIDNNVVRPAIGKLYSKLYVNVTASSTISARNISITNNHVESGEIDLIGISGFKLTNFIVAGNIVDTSTINNGIYLEYVSSGTVSNNVINTASSGVYLTNSDNVLINGNVFSNCTYGIRDVSSVATIGIGLNKFNNVTNQTVGGGPATGPFVDTSSTQLTIDGIKGFTSPVIGKNATTGFDSYGTDNFFGAGRSDTTKSYMDIGNLGDAANVWIDARSSTQANVNVKYRAKGTGTHQFQNDVVVPDEAYGVGWDSSLEVPTKNALYDKIETLGAGATNLAATLSASSTIITSDTGTDATIPAVDATNAGVMTPTQKARLDTITDANYLNSNTTKSQVGLSNVDNTSDVAKPVSTAQQTALDLKANLASPTFTGTVTLPSGQALIAPALGTPASGVATNLTGTAAGLTAGNVTTNANLTGHITSVGNATSLGSFTLAQLSTAVSDANVARTDAAQTFTGVQTMVSPAITTPTGIVKGDVGLGNVDNTSDATKNAAAVTLTNKTLTLPTLSSSAANPGVTDVAGVMRYNSGNIYYGNGSTEVQLVGAASTQTVTNKRVTPRTGTVTSSATPTINTDNVDFFSITAQTVDITSMTTNLSGTPTDGQKLWIAITGTAARAITWGASFESSSVNLPTTTVTTSRLDVGFVWNSVTSKWRCIATA